VTQIEALIAALNRLPPNASDDTIEACVATVLPGLADHDRDVLFGLAVDMVEADADHFALHFLAQWNPEKGAMQ
jgi:hypothetical protein